MDTQTIEEPEPDSANRFYPASIPCFSHEPTRDRFLIQQDPVFGEGVASLVPFMTGDVVFSFTGFYVSEVTQYSLQMGEGLHLHDPYFYGKILHSCAPNTRVNLARRQFIAVRDIYPGDHVTMDYASTEDYLFRTFPCGCGAPKCRKFVAGRKQVPLTTEVQEIPLVAVPIRRVRRTSSRTRKVSRARAQ